MITFFIIVCVMALFLLMSITDSLKKISSSLDHKDKTNDKKPEA